VCHASLETLDKELERVTAALIEAESRRSDLEKQKIEQIDSFITAVINRIVRLDPPGQPSDEVARLLKSVETIFDDLRRNGW
jgi:hypothetical protein